MSAKKHRVDEAAAGSSVPWIEKYRPKVLEEVEAQEEAINALKACLNSGANMPHMLFYGPPGTGKTTAILAVARQLFGPDLVKQRVKELNASDDRGIQVVREKVKGFAHGAVSHFGSRSQSDGKIYPAPPFKLIILDEADALLPDAQAALRRMMEDFSDVTRFCILCNYVSKIIDPITSRCAKFRFKPLTRSSLYHRILHVADEEGIQLSEAALAKLDEAAQGDMRLAIMFLQSAARAIGKNLRDADFVEVSGAVPESVFTPYLTALERKDFDLMYTLTGELVNQGFSAGQVIRQLHRYLVGSACSLSSSERGALALKICETERRVAAGGDDLIQLADLGAAFCSVRP